MKTYRQKRRSRKRKCLHCHELFFPDRRNHWHQRYCAEQECRYAGKRAAQQRWLSLPQNRDYFKNPDNVRRVQEWRVAHPGYWKRRSKRTRNALQDVLSSQPVVDKGDTIGLNCDALQDICSVQPALLVGLIATLTGSTLQDDIAETSRRFIVSGRDILGIGPVHEPKGGFRNGDKAHSLSGASSPHTAAVQLD